MESLKLNLVTTVGMRLGWGRLCWDCWYDYCRGSPLHVLVINVCFIITVVSLLLL